jgi:hypothetical protein
VVVAYATRKWCDSPIFRLIEHTLRCYERAAVDLKFLKSLYLLRYEELVSAPQSTIDRILRFADVGEFRVSEAVARDLNKAYFETWLREQRRIAEAAEAVEPGWLARTEARCRFFGYTLENSEYLPVTEQDSPLQRLSFGSRAR